MRQVIRLLLWSWGVILVIAWLMMRGEIIKPLPVNRIVAGIFLIALIAGLVVEFGWGGGNKNNASHM